MISNKYFTTEYKELCNSKEIRALRLGDNLKDGCFLNRTLTSEELDEEIFKILEEWSKDGDIKYSLNILFISGNLTEYQLTISDKDWEYTQKGPDLLVVKIRTLIRLLEEAK